MKVYLKHNFFANGQRFRKSHNESDLRDIPDSLAELLPKTAKIKDKDAPVPEVKEDDATLATRAFKGTLRLGIPGDTKGAAGPVLAASAASAAQSVLASSQK